MGMQPRIRTVKPTLFQHGDLYDLEESTGSGGGPRLPIRLAFIGLFGYTDCEGRFEWKPRELKVNILPYDDADFGAILEALERGGFIVSYEVEGKKYGLIPTFLDHQTINKREAASSIPPPPASAMAKSASRELLGGFHEYGGPEAAPVAHGEDTGSAPEAHVHTQGVQMGNGIEQNRMELNREKHLVEGVKPRPLPAIKGKRTLEAVTARLAQVMGEVSEGTRARLQRDQLLVMQAEMIFSYWAAKTGHERSIFDAKRERQIIKMLEMNGGDVSELLYVVDGALRDDTIQGKRSDSTRKYDGIETIFRDRAQVERLAGIVKAYREGKTHKLVEKYAAAVRGELPPEQQP